MQRVAKLAGRGSGFPIGLPPPHPPPERLATIEGILDSTVDREQIRAGKGPSREFLTRGEFTIGEIWSLE
ncbi:MAG: hypothetical protein CL933_11800 [Deltaproteobacteria bacterium]|nr:hypothetical protein [Deltaproteobacteria bacterium]